MSYICVGFNGTLLINLATVSTISKGYVTGVGEFHEEQHEEKTPPQRPALLIQFIGGTEKVMQFVADSERDRVFDSLQPRRTGVVLPG